MEGEFVGSDSARPRRGRPGLKFLTISFLGLITVWAVLGLRKVDHPAASAARMAREGPGPQRVAAMGDLERFGPDDPGVAIPALDASLGDPDPRVRSAAASALVLVIRSAVLREIHRPEVLAALANLFGRLEDPEPEVRASAIRAIWMIASLAEGQAGVIDLARADQALVEAASEKEVVVRLAAIRGLGMIAPKVAPDPPPVLTRALEDVDAEVRLASADALLRFREGLPLALPALIRSFETAGPESRSGYLTLLGRIRPRSAGPGMILALASALAGDDPEIRRQVAETLATFGEAARPAIPALVASLGRPGRMPDADEDPTLAAAKALLQITPEFPFQATRPPNLGPESSRTLASVLRSGPPRVRAATARVLGRCLPTSEVVMVLAESARDPEATVRSAALDGLHDISASGPFVPPEVVLAALEDGSPEVRCAAARVLGHAGLGIDPFFPALLRHARGDPDAGVRSSCAFEIHRTIRPPGVTSAVVPALVDALADPAPKVREAACGLLSRLGSASMPAIPGIIRVLNMAADPSAPPDDRFGQQNEAAIALGEVAPGTSEAGPAASALIEALRGGPTLGVLQALPRFGRLARPAIPLLRDLERGKNPAMRGPASKALAAIEDAS